MTNLWDDVPEVHLDGRTVLQYPDPAPESTAAMWEKWREDRADRDQLRGAAPDEDAPDEVYKNHEPPVITLEAEEFDDPCGSLAGYVKLAHGNGWTLVELAHAGCTARGKIIKSGARMGQRHPDRAIDTQWVKLEKAGVGRAVISFTIINDKTDNVYRSFNGLAGRSDAEMKGIIKHGLVQQEQET